MDIKILGTGCAKCRLLEESVRQAVDEMGLDATVEKVSELTEIMVYGIMSTPGLVVDGQVRLTGRLPKLDELKSILESAR
jgi:small redox-active disulfide protein 2